MIKKFFAFMLVLMMFPVFCYGSTVLYRQQESVFVDSADIISSVLSLRKEPIITNERSFLNQIEKEEDILYILTHGLPEEGLMISEDKRVSWDKIAEHIQADVVIVDTCFSGQILEQENWLDKPSLIISSTTKDNYSYNPNISDDYRISLLVTTFFTYFSNKEDYEMIEDYIGIEFSRYNERATKVFGINYMLRHIKYLHLKLYVGLITNENFFRQVKRVEDTQGIPFKGLTSIQYKIMEK